MWGWYLVNLAILVVTNFEISQHPTFFSAIFEFFWKPPNWNLQLLIYITLRQYLPKNGLCFTLTGASKSR